VLQHGSILLAASACAGELPGIVQLSGRRLDSEELAVSWTALLTERLGASAMAGTLTDMEQTAACGFCQSRFASPDYTLRR